MKKIYSLLVVMLPLLNAVNAQNPIIPVITVNGSITPVLFEAPVRTPSHTGGEVIGTLTEEDVRLPAPANDNCSGGLAAAYTLVPDAACTQGNIGSATLEAGETYGCITPTPNWSVWYSFVADATTIYVTASQISGTICSVDYGVRVYKYSGACPPLSGNSVGCTDDQTTVGPNGFADYMYTTVNLTGLTIGQTYMIQITQEACTTGPSNVRQYCIQVGHPTTCTTCSNTCGPECYYPSSSPPSVAWLQANCPLYPERPPMNENDNVTQCYTFTAPNTIVNLQLGNTSFCSGYTYTFNWTCYSASCGSPIASGSYTPTTISGLTVGQNYILCYNYTTTCSWESTWPYIYAASQLPIELVSFQAKPDKNDIDIYWTTASEINTSEFIIEKTTDGQNFSEVKRMKAAGNSTSIINYMIQDLSPVVGTNYYRLKEIDIDGKVTTGELVSARFSRDFSGLSVIPNPAQSEIGVNFSSTKNGIINLSILDAKGIVVFSKIVVADSDGLNTTPINISAFQSGIYSVRLVDAVETFNTRFIKQ